jgi:hypothetical protein
MSPSHPKRGAVSINSAGPEDGPTATIDDHRTRKPVTTERDFRTANTL